MESKIKATSKTEIAERNYEEFIDKGSRNYDEFIDKGSKWAERMTTIKEGSWKDIWKRIKRIFWRGIMRKRE